MIARTPDVAARWRRLVLGPARRLVLALCLLGGQGLGMAYAEDSISVIVGKNPPDLLFTRANLRDIFLKRILVDEHRAGVSAINLSSSSPLRTAFSLSIFGKRPDDFQSYWTEKYFQGVSPPYTVDSEEAMLRFIASTSGAVGYVVSCRVDARVQVVAELPIPAELAAPLHALCAHVHVPRTHVPSAQSPSEPRRD